jgi:aminocarboxymuconate-semialdehyde decarboxylase
MFIDIYTHIFPEKFFARWQTHGQKLANIGKRMNAVKPLSDLDLRFRDMDGHGDYRQIISLPNPPLEEIVDPATGSALARMANDTMAEVCAKHPDRFPGFVAALCLTDLDAAAREIDRAIRDLGAKGIQIFTNIKGEPLDLPKYRPVFAAMAKHDLPIWLHPTRPNTMPDYASETHSRYEMWWAFGWPYETSVAMMRLVFDGLFDRHPGIKIITHHAGGMIPYFAARADAGLAHLGSRTSDEDYSKVLPSLKRPHGEYLRMFYADTAMFGADGYLGTRCGLDYFGADKMVFSTDAPFGPIGDTFGAIDRLGLNRTEAEKIFQTNAEKLMNTKFS